MQAATSPARALSLARSRKQSQADGFRLTDSGKSVILADETKIVSVVKSGFAQGSGTSSMNRQRSRLKRTAEDRTNTVQIRERQA
jgi:hypothetical protein